MNYRGVQIMAKNDNIKLLGERVGYWSDEFKDYDGHVIIPSAFITGLVVGVVVPMEGYEAMAGNDVLLLQDGKDEPDFVSGERDFTKCELTS